MLRHTVLRVPQYPATISPMKYIQLNIVTTDELDQITYRFADATRSSACVSMDSQGPEPPPSLDITVG
jgi:hypothetical protein